MRPAAWLLAAAWIWPAGEAGAQPLNILRGHADEAASVAFFPDGKRLLSAGDDGTLRVWDLSREDSHSIWKGHEAEIGAAVLSRDGRRAVSGGDDLSLRIWDAESGRETGRVEGHKSQTRRLALSPDGNTAATCSWDGHLALWDLGERTLIAALETRETSRVHDAAFSPDGKRLLAAQGDKTLRLWDLGRREVVSVWRGHLSGVLSAAFSPDGKTAVSGSRDNTLRLWNARTGETLRVLRGHGSYVYKAVFSPDGKTILSGGADFTIRLWRAADGLLLKTFWGHQGAVLDVAFSPDGRTAASAGEDHMLMLWDISDPAQPAVPSRVPEPTGGRAEQFEKAELGRMLFFDQRLSGDSSRDCAFCHVPDKSYADGRALSLGYPDTLYFRNVPTLLDLPRQGRLGLDGRFDAGKLPEMLSSHIQEPYFMNSDPRLLVEKLRQAPGYVRAFEKIFGREPVFDAVLESLAAHLRTLRAPPSGDPPSESAPARRGRELFFGRAGCASCHSGESLSDGNLHDRGVPENSEIHGDPLRRASLRLYLKNPDASRDPGPFRTPSLRRAAATAPYMHNGVFKTLEDAVRHENPKLDAEERVDIVAFLKSLSSPVPVPEPPPLPEYGLLGSTAAGPAQTAELAGTADLSRSPGKRRQGSGGLAIDQPFAPDKQFPPLGPLPPIPVPQDNPITPEKVELGKLLFFDHRLSGDGESQCASCHEPAMGWGDSSDLAQGYERTLHWRNAPTLLNAAYYDAYGWDGAEKTLEEHIRASLASNVEMHGNPGMIEERLAQAPEYVERFRKAFADKRPAFASAVKALAAFLRAVPVTGDSPFDRRLRGETDALSSAAERGLALFQGKAACIRCHNGPLLSDGKYHALPVPRNPAFDHIALRQITLRYAQLLRGRPLEEVLGEAEDPGRLLITRRPEDQGKFRTPGLRELVHTAPYMHNGTLATLSEVVAFYDRSLKLDLTPREKSDLEEFLKALSGNGVYVEQPEKPGRRLSTSEYWR